MTHAPDSDPIPSLGRKVAVPTRTTVATTHGAELGRVTDPIRNLFLENRVILRLDIQGNQNLAHRHVRIDPLAKMLIEVSMHSRADGAGKTLLLCSELEKLARELGSRRVMVNVAAAVTNNELLDHGSIP